MFKCGVDDVCFCLSGVPVFFNGDFFSCVLLFWVSREFGDGCVVFVFGCEFEFWHEDVVYVVVGVSRHCDVYSDYSFVFGYEFTIRAVYMVVFSMF